LGKAGGEEAGKREYLQLPSGKCSQAPGTARMIDIELTGEVTKYGLV